MIEIRQQKQILTENFKADKILLAQKLEEMW